MEVVVSQIEKRSWIEIDTAQLRQNYLCYKNSLKKDASIMAVIKADAYGHGDVQVARVLEQCGCSLFAVSNIDEAIGLREAGIKGEILLLGYSSPIYAKTLVDYDLTQAIVSKEYAKALSDTGISVKCQFAIDTGMNRIGLDGDMPEESETIIREFSEKLNVNGLFTHLCVADAKDEESVLFTRAQIRKFESVVNRVSDLSLPYIHCCNSAGGLEYLDDSNVFESIGKIVRLGIILYGLKPDLNFVLPKGIAPALTWKSSVSMVKTIHRGETVGYGRTYRADKDVLVATVTTGYADGLNRLLSNKGFVLIHGKRAPIIGRICMDQTMVDVTDIPNVRMGDKVVIIGRSGPIEYSADDMAYELNTIGYEVLCNISKRVQRFYVNSNIYM